MSSALNLPNALPPSTQTLLQDFIAKAREAFQDDLLSAVLFGSAAEGRLRATSDVNLILVLKHFPPHAAAALATPMAIAHAGIQLEVMFLEQPEIPAAVECFAQKFADILRRRHVIWGPDPFAATTIPRDAEIRRTRQVLLNMTLRLRERSVSQARQNDQLLASITDFVAPLRTCAASILHIEGVASEHPREAFAALLAQLQHPEWNYLPTYLSTLREGSALPEPDPATVLHHLLALATVMRLRVESHL